MVKGRAGGGGKGGGEATEIIIVPSLYLRLILSLLWSEE